MQNRNWQNWIYLYQIQYSTSISHQWNLASEDTFYWNMSKNWTFFEKKLKIINFQFLGGIPIKSEKFLKNSLFILKFYQKPNKIVLALVELVAKDDCFWKIWSKSTATCRGIQDMQQMAHNFQQEAKNKKKACII